VDGRGAGSVLALQEIEAIVIVVIDFAMFKTDPPPCEVKHCDSVLAVCVDGVVCNEEILSICSRVFVG
jgi:hypothetical protein